MKTSRWKSVLCMNMLREILKRQKIIDEIKRRPAARTAISYYAQRYLPRHVRDEIRQTAQQAGVEAFDVLCVNLSYEVAIVATTPGELDLSGLWKSLVDVKEATRVGCTTFVHWSESDVELCGTTSRMTSRATFARNLDWPDPDGLLKQSTFLRRYEATKERHHFFGGVTPGRKAFQSLTFPGYSGVLTGFAPGRFAVALNAVLGDGPIRLGEAPSFLTRRAMEECETFDEALRLLSRTPLICGALFTLVNAQPCAGQKTAVVIERSSDRYAIRRASQFGDDYVVAATNDYLVLGDGKSAELRTSPIGATSCKRYASVMEHSQYLRELHGLAPQADIPESVIRDILREQEFGCTVHAALFDPACADDILWD